MHDQFIEADGVAALLIAADGVTVRLAAADIRIDTDGCKEIVLT